MRVTSLAFIWHFVFASLSLLICFQLQIFNSMDKLLLLTPLSQLSLHRWLTSWADFHLSVTSWKPNCLIWCDRVRICAVFNGPSTDPPQHPHVWLGRPHAGWEAGGQLCGSRSDDIYISVPLLWLNPCWYLVLLFTSQVLLRISVRRPWLESSTWFPPAPALPGLPAYKTVSLKPKKVCTSWTNEMTNFSVACYWITFKLVTYFVFNWRLLAQLHDELLYEVEDSQVQRFAGKFTVKLYSWSNLI